MCTIVGSMMYRVQWHDHENSRESLRGGGDEKFLSRLEKHSRKNDEGKNDDVSSEGKLISTVAGVKEE